MTNADKLRPLSEKEMAHFIFREIIANAKYCSIKECTDNDDCEYCMAEWLKQEAEG